MLVFQHVTIYVYYIARNDAVLLFKGIIVICRKKTSFIARNLRLHLSIYRTQLCSTGPRSAVGNVATDACLTTDPGVASSIPVRSHTFVEIDHEIISTVILLPSTDLFKKGCCQLQAKVCARITG